MKHYSILLTIFTLITPLFASCNFAREGKDEPVEVYDTISLPMPDSLFVVAKDSVVLQERKAAMIVVDKEQMTVSVLGFKSDTLFSVSMCCGKQFGDKQITSDDRTPEGVFRVRRIENSSLWPHKLKNGEVEYDSYGPYFIRLDYPPIHRIGIHGTKAPNSIGKRESEGCIRVTNENIRRLVKFAYVGMPVVITPSKDDIKANAEYLNDK